MASCIKRHTTIAFAESCTGGRMAARVTSVAGASRYFLGSFIVYSNAMKEEVLGVSKQTLLSQGAVSKEAVRQMLAGVFQKCSADYAIAVSGIAGPGGATEEASVGTIWAAIGERGKLPDVGKFHLSGNRETVMQSAVDVLLEALWRKIEHGTAGFS